MKKTILFLALLALGSASAMALPTRQNRDDSLLMVGYSPIGLHIPTLLTMPVSVGLYLGTNWLVGAESGSFSIDSGDVGADSGDTFEGEFSNRGVFGRWFPGTNSFNFLLALHQRNWEIRFGTTISLDAGGSAPISATLTTEATVATLGIGNQWMMDFGMIVGVDWLVVSGLLMDDAALKVDAISILGVELDPDAAVALGLISQADVDRANKEAQKAGDIINDISAFPGILVLTLGWAF
ncbi:MAG: hypothetical protein O7G32_04255 [SAR324 cluster bacterium]|nr:hypothetical protein [SAR324 cluster bacterium]